VSSRPSGVTLVAVLGRRGRFMTAEPLFAAPARPAGRSGRSAAGGGIVIGQAGGSRASRSGAREGDIVLLGTASRRGGARILRRIGRPEVARDVIEALLLHRDLRSEFDHELEREAAAAGGRVMGSARDRRDLRELPTFTIDPVSARDFDDAISAREGEAGRTTIWVHIADVAAHVPEGSRIDREARRRSTSVYAPGTVEPMLPHALSSDACSLRPGVDRAAVTVELEMDGARVLGASFYRSLIRSDERLDYERVDEIFAGREQAREPWAAPLRAARRIATELQGKREAGGALSLDSPEPEFVFDERGNVVEVHGRTQTESHRLIEHLMIAANEAVATLLSQRGVPCLYRVHERPDPDRVQRLVDQLASLEVPTPPVPDRMSSTQAAELLGHLSVRVQEHIRRNRGRGRMALGSLVLRSLKQAYYSPVNLGHAGLQSSAYCHFTSPIRRYPDLVCHRALLSAVGGGETAPSAAELPELGAWTSEREREAMILERDADDVASCFALERRLRRDGPGQVLGGEITGLIGAGAFVAFSVPNGEEKHAGEAPPFEGMLPVRLLRAPDRARGNGGGERRGASGSGGRGRQQPREESRDWWELNEEGTILRGERTGATLRLGDEVKVRVARIEAIRGRVDLEPAG
jgi:ribonuclease R